MSSVAVIPLAKTVFAAEPSSTLRTRIESSLGEHLSSALLRERTARPTVSTGITTLDTLTGGLPRGALSEFAGPVSSGRTGAMLASLAGATQRQEICALVDASDSFNPASAATAGVNLDRLLWVRCQEDSTSQRQRKPWRETRDRPPSRGFAFSEVLEQVLKVTDLLLQGGGFGMVVLDLGDIPAESVRRIPLTSWFRFRRAVEPTATVLLLIEQEPCAKTCASLVLRLQPESVYASNSVHPESVPKKQAAPSYKTGDALPHIPTNNAVSHADLFRGMRFQAEMVRSSMQRKSPHSLGTYFELRAAL